MWKASGTHAHFLSDLWCTLLKLVLFRCRRLEQELKLSYGDVLHTSLAAILTEKLHKEAKSGMGES